MSKDCDLLRKKHDLTLLEHFTPALNTIIKDSESKFSPLLFHSNVPDILNFESNNSCIKGSESESNLLHFSDQSQEDTPNPDIRIHNFLQRKRSKDKYGFDTFDEINDDSDEIKNSMGAINNEENNNQDISTKNTGKILLLKTENEFQNRYEGDLRSKNNTFQVKFVTNKINQNGPNGTKNSKNSASERGKDKDNFSIKLFTYLNHWILERLNSNSNSNQKLHPPNYDIFTHNTNLVDIFVFLDIQYKNFLCLTPKDKETLDQLLFYLEIKKQNKKKETKLTEKSKKYKDVIKLLRMDGYINEKKYQILKKLIIFIYSILKIISVKMKMMMMFYIKKIMISFLSY